ncbi:amino acid ABC transporter permease, partial [Mesorhizobium sp. M2D.F.Ca.ET.160.01.1.1]
MASQEILREEPSRGSFVNDPRIRRLFFQTLVVVLLFGSIWWIVQNVIDNLHRLHIASGFGFLKGRAGFDISDTPIAYTSDSTYGRAIIVGLINTIIVAAAGIITATIIG